MVNKHTINIGLNPHDVFIIHINPITAHRLYSSYMTWAHVILWGGNRGNCLWNHAGINKKRSRSQADRAQIVSADSLLIVILTLEHTGHPCFHSNSEVLSSPASINIIIGKMWDTVQKLRSHFGQVSAAPNEGGSFVTEPDHLVMIQLSSHCFSEHNWDGSVYQLYSSCITFALRSHGATLPLSLLLSLSPFSVPFSRQQSTMKSSWIWLWVGWDGII